MTARTSGLARGDEFGENEETGLPGPPLMCGPVSSFLSAPAGDQDPRPERDAPEAIEYGLMIDWEDGQPAEFVPAKSFDHAEEMARRLYSGRSCWTVGRDVQPWRYVRRGDAVLTEVFAR